MREHISVCKEQDIDYLRNDLLTKAEYFNSQNTHYQNDNNFCQQCPNVGSNKPRIFNVSIHLLAPAGKNVMTRTPTAIGAHCRCGRNQLFASTARQKRLVPVNTFLSAFQSRIKRNCKKAITSSTASVSPKSCARMTLNVESIVVSPFPKYSVSPSKYMPCLLCNCRKCINIDIDTCRYFNIGKKTMQDYFYVLKQREGRTTVPPSHTEAIYFLKSASFLRCAPSTE